MEPPKDNTFFHTLSLPVAVAVLLAATLAMFAHPLFLADDRIISRSGTDTYSLFVYWRDFGFSQMRQGNLPLWNPHLFSGMPCLGVFQSALLYPLNWIYLFLPMAKAINISLVAHVFLIGMFMYLWTSSRGLHPAACLTAALAVMFSGANFMHVYAGHLIDICTMAWAPLILLAIDRLFHRPSLGWHLLGMLAVSMQILAGHPQYVYYTGITALLHAAFSLRHQDRPVSRILSFACIYAGGIAISAIQLFSGIETARETVRSAGVSYQFAAMFSYPPENLISLIAPFFFGDIQTVPYWGRAYLWAMTLYIGTAGLMLSLCGVIWGKKETRRFSAVMVVLLVILALGKNTPLFQLLYNYLPAFNMLRGTSKFIFPATLFLAMLAAIGLDVLIRGKTATKSLTAILLVIGCLLLAAGLIVNPQSSHAYSGEIIRHVMGFVSSTREAYVPPELYKDGAFLLQAALFSAKGLLFSATIVFALALILTLVKYFRNSVYLICILAAAEIFAFAWHIHTDFDVKDTAIPELNRFFQDRPGDYRVLNLIKPNSAMATGVHDIWGYDPGVLLRYAQFIGFTQGCDPRDIVNYVTFQKYHRLFSMLRLRYIITSENNRIKLFEFQDDMPRLQLVEKWEVVAEKKGILRKMDQDSFDPRKTVLLEQSPGIGGSPASGEGLCQIIDHSTDHLTVRAKTPRDAILLITDSYSKGWQIAPLHTAGQQNYTILPANYMLMAVPLKAGEHTLRLEYAPAGYRVGKWVSLGGLSMYLIAAIYCVVKRPRHSKGQPSET